MKKNRKGITLIALVITVIVLIILVGVAISYVVGDNGVVTNAMKMELETTKGELRDHMLLRLNEELVSASADIYSTSQDIGSRYNEQALVYYLTGHQNYPGTDHAEEITDKCIEPFEDGTNGVVQITNLKHANENSPLKDIKVMSKYRIVSTALCPKGDKYGVGKNISNGNIFTLEAIGVTEDGNTDNYDGKYEIVYYDNNGNRSVIETVSLYITNQS